MAYAHVSRLAQALDRDFQSIYGAGWPVRSSEALLTAVYQYEVRAGSSSAIPAAAQPTRSDRCAAMRTVVKF
jgi:hypothetical protein